MILSRPVRWLLGLAMLLGLAFVYVPLAIVVVNSFNTSQLFAWPPPGYTTEWWQAAAQNEGVRDALTTSIIVALAATAIALVLGTLTAMAVSRYDFWGRNTISILFVLPIALPGIVTGLALNSVFTTFLGGLTLVTLIVGHATFCVVVVLNNAAARLRRTVGNVEEAARTSAPRERAPSATSPSQRCARLSWPAGCWRSACRSTRSSSPPSRRVRESRPCRCGSTRTCSVRTTPRSSTLGSVLVVVSVIPVYLAQRLSSDAAGGGRI